MKRFSDGRLWVSMTDITSTSLTVIMYGSAPNSGGDNVGVFMSVGKRTIRKKVLIASKWLQEEIYLQARDA
jgi:hypothetical protein